VTTTPAPRVSFAMSCHGYGRYLRKSLESILTQRNCDLEVIVIDDGSTDETGGVLRSYVDEARVRIVHHETRRGHLRSNNEGLAMARGEFVGVFDADDFLLHDDAVARKVEIFDAHPSVGFVYSAYLLVDEENVPFRSFRPWENDYVRSGLDEFRHLVRTCYVPHSSTLVRRAFHERPDQVYELTLPYAADWDLWLRLCARHDVGYIAETLQAYRQHRSQMSSSTIAPRAATDDLLRTVDRAFAALDPGTARAYEQLRHDARTAALLHQTRTDRSLGRVRRSWSGLIEAGRRTPRLLASIQFYWALARLVMLTALGQARYARLVSTRDRLAGGKGPVA
jgi:glycosyltransferase involved in cell wall biosynthesis